MRALRTLLVTLATVPVLTIRMHTHGDDACHAVSKLNLSAPALSSPPTVQVQTYSTSPSVKLHCQSRQPTMHQIVQRWTTRVSTLSRCTRSRVASPYTYCSCPARLQHASLHAIPPACKCCALMWWCSRLGHYPTCCSKSTSAQCTPEWLLCHPGARAKVPTSLNAARWHVLLH